MAGAHGEAPAQPEGGAAPPSGTLFSGRPARPSTKETEMNMKTAPSGVAALAHMLGMARTKTKAEGTPPPGEEDKEKPKGEGEPTPPEDKPKSEGEPAPPEDKPKSEGPGEEDPEDKPKGEGEPMPPEDKPKGDGPTEEDPDEEMRGDAPAAAARRRERARCAAILSAPEAEANPALARQLAFATALPRGEALAILKGAGAPAAKAGLSGRMAASGQPSIPPDAPAKDPSASAADRMAARMASAGGNRVKPRAA